MGFTYSLAITCLVLSLHECFSIESMAQRLCGWNVDMSLLSSLMFLLPTLLLFFLLTKLSIDMAFIGKFYDPIIMAINDMSFFYSGRT